MIVKDEEDVLERCLVSVKDLVDEIIIVDTGSTDRTKEIAGKFTDKIYDFKWIDDFAAARNFAFSKAAMDYILWLDADDVLLENDQKKLQALKNSIDHSYDAVSMIYNTAHDEYGNPTFTFRRHRLVKRSMNFKWIGAVHEYLDVGGNILNSDIAVTHRKETEKKRATGRNLRIYENRIKKGETLSPRDLYYYANELKDHGQYKKAILYYEKFLALKKGWIEDVISACGYIADCYARLGKNGKEIEAVLRSFKYDQPRAKNCYRLGEYFMTRNNYQAAIFWFNMALSSDQDDNGGFRNPAYSTWYPHLQLCICYWKLGELEKSRQHNEKAAKYRPEDPSVMFNRKFFDDYFNNQKI